MITLTLDTDVLRDYLDPAREHHDDAKALVQLDDQGICEIRIVSRFTADVPDGAPARSFGWFIDLPASEIPSIAQWDISEWDADFWASDEDDEIYSQIFHMISRVRS